MRLLFAFWNRARDGVVDELFLSNGIAGPLDVKAPLGIYCQPGLHPSMPESLIAIQHGSLQDSVTSFNGVHCNVSRTETGYFNDQIFLLGKLCAVAGLDPNKLEVIDCVGCSVRETCV